ncbi:ThiF family adenylyltransferase [Candidatus Woesearchaeota archaeon]|nr:ThiF family adenylyltransferase [Candidatus Woesearchaeota archaeon]
MRYEKQVIFERIGQKGQDFLSKAHVCIVGLGALGSYTSNFLVRAGINKLTLIDRDVIEESNLQRQNVYGEQDIGRLKTEVLTEKLLQINSKIQIKSYFADLTHKNSSLLKSDLILDCTDNMETRFLINDFALKNNIPWIYSAVLGSEGMVMNIIPKKTPCFRCIFQPPTSQLGTCDTEGIINTIPAAISALQVTETIKIITKQAYSKELIHFEIWKGKLSKTKTKKLQKCPACSGNYEFLNGEKATDAIKLCGVGTYQITGPKLNLTNLSKNLPNARKMDSYVNYNNNIFFEDGRVIIKAKSLEEAKSIYSKYIGN